MASASIKSTYNLPDKTYQPRFPRVAGQLEDWRSAGEVNGHNFQTPARPPKLCPPNYCL